MLYNIILVYLSLTQISAQWVEPPPKYECPERPLYPCKCLRGGDEGVYIKCNNTNIASLSVGLRQVRTLVHTLTIENCNIEKLYGSLFQLLSVRILEIKDTPIKDISDHTFDGVIGDAMEVSTYVFSAHYSPGF